MNSTDLFDDCLAADKDGSGASGGYKGICFALVNEIQPNHKGRILFGLNGFHGRLSGFNDFGSVHHLHTAFLIGIPGKLRADAGLRTGQYELDSAVLLKRIQSPLHGLLRSIITAHGIYNYSDFFIHNFFTSII